MGAGKSSVGRRLAARLGMPFVDADTEIEKAADMSIPEIFARHGEPYFRAGETRVIARILDGGPQVLATGGGAFMNAETRAADPRQGHLGLAARGARSADATRQAPQRPAAAQGRRSGRDVEAADGRALSDLCRSRSHGGIARRAARGHRRRGRSRACASICNRIRPRKKPNHDRAASLRRSHHRQRRARRPRLRHRDRPRAACHARRADRRSSGPAARSRSSPTPRWPNIISRRPKPRFAAAGIASSSVKRAAARARAARASSISSRCATRSSPPRSSAAISSWRWAAAWSAISAALPRPWFAAGVDYVQVPTIAAGAGRSRRWAARPRINSRHGKNLIGAFYQPILVVADTAVLDTLPAREFRAGYAESW